MKTFVETLYEQLSQMTTDFQNSHEVALKIMLQNAGVFH